MMGLTGIENDEALDNPLDLAEEIARDSGWECLRAGEDELLLAFAVGNTEVQISLSWLEPAETFHLAAAFGFVCPERRQTECMRLLTRINTSLPCGHFELWPDGTVMYRNALMLAGGASLSPAQCEAMIASAIGACETFYPALQFVIWAGRGAEEALRDCIFETAGEA